MTPIWFGSRDQLLRREGADGRASATTAPSRSRSAPSRARSRPRRQKVSGFVFKVQANMDPKHRDRVAFVRLASGHFERGMKLTHVRSKKPMTVSNPVLFLASDRELAEEAWAGDIIGIPNHGQLRIGDTLTEGEALRVTGIPSFAPELLQIGARGRSDEGQAPRKGADAVRRGRRGQGLQADDRLGLHRRRRRRAAVRGAGQPDRAGIRPAGALRAVAIHLRPLGARAQGTRSRPSPPRTSSTSPTTTTATSSTSPACNGTSTASSATIPM